MHEVLRSHVGQQNTMFMKKLEIINDSCPQQKKNGIIRSIDRRLYLVITTFVEKKSNEINKMRAYCSK